jgi:hypothetical protein
MTDYGWEQAVTLGLQKAKLHDPFMTLPLRLLLSSLGVDRCIGPAPRVLLSHLSSLVHLHKLTLDTLSCVSLSARVTWSSASQTRAATL